MVHRNYRKAAAVVLASLLLICTLALAACGGTSDSKSNTTNSAQSPTTTSAPTTDSPTASAEKIKNIDQQVQDASSTLDSTKKDADTAGQQSSENDLNP